jgi:copper(I)-binding protein
VIPAHGRLVLSVGHGHVMIENVFGTLKPGDNVNMTLTFEKAGTININAPVRRR